MKISDFTIGTRLIVSFLMVIAIMGGATSYQIVQMKYLSELYNKSIIRNKDAVAVKDITIRLEELYSIITDAIINRNLEESRKLFHQAKLGAQKDIASVKGMSDTTEEKAWAEMFSDKYQNYIKIFEEQMLMLLKENPEKNTEQIRELDDQIDTVRETAKALLNNISQSFSKEEEEADALFVSTHQQTIRLSLILTVSGILIALIMAFLIIRSITKPLAEAVSVNRKLADGDLNIDVDANRKDEVGQLLVSMDKMLASLKKIIFHVQDGTQKMMQMAEIMDSSAQQLTSVSIQTSSGAEELSQGASEQASSTEEVSSSMEEMLANISQNADNAKQTEKIALKSASDAQKGGNAVEEVIAAMKSVAGKILIIEEIARQTNLLALNAAIEAARAGEHGKGFAVVASEVRKLAEKSQKAAAEINQLSVSSVGIAENAGEMLRLMVPNIRKTAELVQEISSACEEQNSVSQQIGKAVTQLDQVTQQNASAAEELSSSAEELSSTAEVVASNSKELLEHTTLIRTAMAFFKLDDLSYSAKPQHGVSDYKSSEDSDRHRHKSVSETSARKSLRDRNDEKFELY